MNGRSRLPRGLYFVADAGLLAGERLVAVTRAALQGGVVLVQFRAKRLTAAEMEPLARRLLAVCDEFEVPLLINDLPEVAAAVGAAGVHVGQEDVTVAHARDMLGDDAIVGATTPTVEAVRRAEQEGADYVSVGPMFRSPTKPWKPVAGPELACRLRRETKLPLCVIGGIDAGNVHHRRLWRRPGVRNLGHRARRGPASRNRADHRRHARGGRRDVTLPTVPGCRCAARGAMAGAVIQFL